MLQRRCRQVEADGAGSACNSPVIRVCLLEAPPIVPSAPSLRLEAVRLLEHIWIPMDGVADVDGCVTLGYVKACDGGVLNTQDFASVSLLGDIPAHRSSCRFFNN